MADKDSKTEKATPKKRSDERKKGHVFMSQDAVSVVTLLASFSVFFIMGPKIADDVAAYIRFCFDRCGMMGSTELLLSDLAKESVMLLVRTVLPLLLVTAVSAVAATFLQTRMLVSRELIKPKLSKINPLAGLKRMFSFHSLMDALKGIAKITILLLLIYLSLKSLLEECGKYLYTDIQATVLHMFAAGKSMVMHIVLAFIALAAVDFIYQWRSFEKDMRMSKEEIKEEFKQTEGDPQIKGKIKEMQRKRAMSRMMQQVPQADVVVRNPTHFAVALRYRPEIDSAPIVLAKGQDELALRIVKVAEEAGVAVMENVPLARALYAQAELNQEIPQELYSPVAEVLVYIFKLNDEKKLVK